MRIQSFLNLIVNFTVIILLGLFCYLGLHVFVADSEFWSISLGYHLPQEFLHEWVFTRPVFYIGLWLTQLGTYLPSASVHSARMLFILNGLLIGFLVFKILRYRTGSYLYGSIGLLLLFSNTGFLNQGFRIRSDLIATTLSLLAIYLLSQERMRDKKNIHWIIFIPLLATPKALLQVVALLPIAWKRIFSTKRVWYICGLLFFVSLIFLINQNNYTYLKNSIYGRSGGPPYFSLESLDHLLNQFKRNPIFWSLFLFRFMSYRQMRALMARPEEERHFEWMVVLFFFALCLYPEKVQFFIASLLPFFAIQAALFFYDLMLMRKEILQRVLIAVSCIALLLGGIFWFDNCQFGDSNKKQLATLDRTYQFLIDRGIPSFYDFTCLIPPYCSNRHFIGPHQIEMNKEALNELQRNPPEVLFVIPKASLLGESLPQFLSRFYLPRRWGVFVLRPELRQGEIMGRDRTSGVENQPIEDLQYQFGYDVNY